MAKSASALRVHEGQRTQCGGVCQQRLKKLVCSFKALTSSSEESSSLLLGLSLGEMLISVRLAELISFKSGTEPKLRRWLEGGGDSSRFRDCRRSTSCEK